MIKRASKYLFGLCRFIFFKTYSNGNDMVGNLDMPGYIFKEIGEKSFESDPIFAAWNRSQRFQKRCKQGHLCYGFFNKDNSVASYVWISSSNEVIEIPLVFSVKLILRPGSGYIWDCFTAHDHRQQGLYRKGLISAKLILLKNGIKSAYICCNDYNNYSRDGILSAGFEKISTSLIIKIGPVRIVKKSGKRAKIMGRTRSFDVIGK